MDSATESCPRCAGAGVGSSSVLQSPEGMGLICDSISTANLGGLCLWTVLEDADTGWEQWRGGTQAEGEGWMPRAAIPITGGAARVTAS